MAKTDGRLLARAFISAATLADLEGRITATLMTPQLMVSLLLVPVQKPNSRAKKSILPSLCLAVSTSSLLCLENTLRAAYLVITSAD